MGALGPHTILQYVAFSTRTCSSTASRSCEVPDRCGTWQYNTATQLDSTRPDSAFTWYHTTVHFQHNTALFDIAHRFGILYRGSTRQISTETHSALPVLCQTALYQYSTLPNTAEPIHRETILALLYVALPSRNVTGRYHYITWQYNTITSHHKST